MTLYQSALFAALFAAASSSQAQQPAIAEHATHPVVSPDGKHVVFGSDRDGTTDLYLIDENGENTTRLTNNAASEGIVAWNANGRRVFYSIMSGDTATLFSISITGGAPAKVGTVVGRGVRLSRDGTRAIAGQMPWQSMQVTQSKLDGSNKVQLTDGTAAYYCSAYSDDSKFVATSRSSGGQIQIWILNASSTNGKNGRQLTHFSASEGSAQCPSWSADGKLLAIQSDVADKSNSALSSSHIWLLDVASGARTKLAPHTDPYLDELPSWFPDGKRIAFQSNRSGRWEIWTMKSDGTDVRQLTK